MARETFKDYSIDSVLERSEQKTLRRLSKLARDYRNGRLPRSLSREDLDYVEKLRQIHGEMPESKAATPCEPIDSNPRQMTLEGIV